MTRAIAVLRPEPGNRATIERLTAAGLPSLALPLFEVAPLDWDAPSAEGFDRLLLTSANAVRHGGARLTTLRTLSVVAVGEATATAARDAGFTIATTGSTDLAELLATLPAGLRLLWLAGADRTTTANPKIVATRVVYAAHPRQFSQTEAESLAGSVALVHSTRAAHQLAAQLDQHGVARGTVRLAAISAKAANATSGWAQLAIAALPNDDALIDAARALAIDP